MEIETYVKFIEPKIEQSLFKYNTFILLNSTLFHVLLANMYRLECLCSNFREFNLLSMRALQQAVREETMVCERLNLLLDVLVAHRSLCERHERGVSADHQRALSTMLSLKKRQMQGVIRGTDVSKILRHWLSSRR